MHACRNYLEVGVCAGATFSAVDVANRVGVDPAPLFDTRLMPDGVTFFLGSSDDYFSTLSDEVRFDLVFLDGLHHWDQTYVDLLNTLQHSHPRTLIVVDDVLPDHYLSALRDESTSKSARSKMGIDSTRWHGDVFKVLAVIRAFHPDLDYIIVGNNSEGDNAQAIIWQTNSDTPKETPPVPITISDEVRRFADSIAISPTLFVDYAHIFSPHMNERHGIAKALVSSGQVKGSVKDDDAVY